MDDFIDAVELARRLKCKVGTIAIWRRQGLIPCLRISKRPILFDWEEVKRVLREQGKQAPRWKSAPTPNGGR